MLRSLIFFCLSPHHEPLYTYTSIHCGLMSGLHWLTNFCRFWSEVLPSAPECSGALESEFNADFTVLPSCMHLPSSCLSCTYAHACISLSSIPVDICYMLNETKSFWKSPERLVETDSVSGEGGAFSNKTFPPRNMASGPSKESLVFQFNQSIFNQFKQRFLGTTNPGGDSFNFFQIFRARSPQWRLCWGIGLINTWEKLVCWLKKTARCP